MSKRSNKFSSEVRKRVIRKVHECRGELPSLWAAIEFIAPKIGCTPQTFKKCFKRDEIDTGSRAGVKRNQHRRADAIESICMGLQNAPSRLAG